MGKAPESTEDHIHTVAAKREELLSILAATEHAKASLTRAKLNVAALKGPWYDSDALCSDLNARKIDIRKEYEDLRDSHVRKLFGGSKFQETLKAKEEDLAEVEEWYAKADQARVEPKKKLDEAKEVRDKLEKLVEEHLQAEIGLEELYASVFDGPSPANAEEDALELELSKAQDIFDPIQADVSKAATVVNYIAMARMRINFASARVAQALHISQADMNDHAAGVPFGSIHTFNSATADIKERRELEWVRRCMAEASQFLAMAHELDPEVRGFVMPKIADGHSLAGKADSWINTPVTDYLFHREIAATGQGVMMAGAIIDEELELADKKVVVLAAKRDAAGKDLKEARKKLHDLRGRIFENAVNSKGGAPVPSYETAMTTEEAPSYSEGEASRQTA